MNEAVSERLNAEAQARLELLRARAGRCVCKYCGGRLRLRQITFSQFEDARIELFCQDCDRLEFGVEPQIYAAAKYFVQESGYNSYPDLDDSDKTRQMNIARVCEIMTWENQSFGFLTAAGFAVPVQINEEFAGECTIFTADDLQDAR